MDLTWTAVKAKRSYYRTEIRIEKEHLKQCLCLFFLQSWLYDVFVGDCGEVHLNPKGLLQLRLQLFHRQQQKQQLPLPPSPCVPPSFFMTLFFLI